MTYFYDDGHYITNDQGSQKFYYYTIKNPTDMQVNYTIMGLPDVYNFFNCFKSNDSIYSNYPIGNIRFIFKEYK